MTHRSARRPGLAVPFGERDGRMFTPEQVAVGRACGCICAECKAPLVARNREFDGRKRRPYFAHDSGSTCAGAFETALHKMAKQVLVDAREIVLPTWSRASSPVLDADGVEHVARHEIPAQVLRYEAAELEVAYDGFRVDAALSVTTQHPHPLLVEICVMHPVDAAKAASVRTQGAAMIEINMSGLDASDCGIEDVRAAVLEDEHRRKWIHHPHAELVLAQKEDALRRTIDEARLQRIAAFEANARLHAAREQLLRQYRPPRRRL